MSAKKVLKKKPKGQQRVVRFWARWPVIEIRNKLSVSEPRRALQKEKEKQLLLLPVYTTQWTPKYLHTMCVQTLWGGAAATNNNSSHSPRVHCQPLYWIIRRGEAIFRASWLDPTHFPSQVILQQKSFENLVIYHFQMRMDPFICCRERLISYKQTSIENHYFFIHWKNTYSGSRWKHCQNLFQT